MIGDRWNEMVVKMVVIVGAVPAETTNIGQMKVAWMKEDPMTEMIVEDLTTDPKKGDVTITEGPMMIEDQMIGDVMIIAAMTDVMVEEMTEEMKDATTEEMIIEGIDGMTIQEIVAMKDVEAEALNPSEVDKTPLARFSFRLVFCLCTNVSEESITGMFPQLVVNTCLQWRLNRWVRNTVD